ncbi:MAG: TCP-1/cpn60 chaperonin family protein [Caldilineaceae bacterium]
MNRPQVVGQPTTYKQIQRGINVVVDLLAPTLGPTGGNIVSQTDRSERYELLTDSAVALRRVISLGSPQLDIGAMTVRSMVWRVGQRAGDGGATTAVLMRALFNEGVRQIAAGANAMQLTRGMRQAADLVIDGLRAQARPIAGEDELAAVARTITQEAPLAAVLGEMSYLLGPDAHVSIEKFVAPYLQRRYIGGARYKAEIASMYFYSDSANKVAVAPAPAVAVVADRLTQADEVIPLMEAAIANGKKALVIIAPAISGDALGLLVHNHQQPEDKRKLQVLAAKLTSVGDELRQAQDIALMVGPTCWAGDESTARPKAPRRPGRSAARSSATRRWSSWLHRGERETIQQEVTNLRNQLARLPLDDDERPKVVRRLSTLTGGVGELEGRCAHQEPARPAGKHGGTGAEGALRGAEGRRDSGAGAALHHCVPQLRAAADAAAAGNPDLALGMRGAGQRPRPAGADRDHHGDRQSGRHRPPAGRSRFACDL